MFDNIASVDEWYAKDLQIFAVCLSVNNKLCGQAVSTLPMIIIDSFRDNLATLYVTGLNFSSSESGNITPTLL